MNELVIAWEHEASRLPELVDLFLSNIDERYISFTEMQQGRADSDQEWSQDLRKIISADLSAAMVPPHAYAMTRVAVARLDGVTVGLALVSLHPDARRPFAVLEDLVVHRDFRARGIGRRILSWVLEECQRAGCGRIFLESGIRNAEAHRFFESAGFHPISTVFVRNP